MTTKVVSEAEIDKITCPGCKANIEIERDKPTHRIIEHEHEDGLREKLEKLEKMITSKVEPEKPQKEEIAIPDYMPYYHCKNGNCDMPGHLHKNKKVKRTKRRKCERCEQLNVEGAHGCDSCGKVFEDEDDYEDLDNEQLKERFIPIATPYEDHEHE